MRTTILVLGSALMLATAATAMADPINLFSRIKLSDSGESPPPDTLAAYDSALDIRGIASMPDEIVVRIPRADGDLVATIRRERMDRREGYVDRDPVGCNSDKPPPGACDQIPDPDGPENGFSYSWVGRGSDYDLRLSIHRGNAIGILVGQAGRFAVSWGLTKQLRLEYFNMDDTPPIERIPASAPANASVHEMSARAAQSATIATIPARDLGPSGSSNAQLDIAYLFTEVARVQAGGNPSDCRDTAGVMNQIYARLDQMNEAFVRSQIPAQIGAIAVTRLYGYALIPFDGNPNTSTNVNLLNITNDANVRAYRNAVGADLVSVLFDTQANLGPCGVSNVQRHGCTYPMATPGCDVGSQFAEWSTNLDTIECTAVDVPTHELGHLLGAEHHYDGQAVPRTVASYPYSYGYGYGSSSLPGSFETIMSQQFTFPVRLLQFSNPDISYAGHPTGKPPGATGQADNALTLTNLAPGTAAFRARQNSIFASGFDEQIACPGITY